jgi:hypothetical protein
MGTCQAGRQPVYLIAAGRPPIISRSARASY